MGKIIYEPKCLTREQQEKLANNPKLLEEMYQPQIEVYTKLLKNSKRRKK